MSVTVSLWNLQTWVGAGGGAGDGVRLNFYWSFVSQIADVFCSRNEWDLFRLAVHVQSGLLIIDFSTSSWRCRHSRVLGDIGILLVDFNSESVI